jgi:hypothetical protein
MILGLLVWAIPFAISFAAYPLHAPNRALFESIMAVVVTGTVALLALMYLRPVRRAHAREGLLVGALWYVISFLIDQAMFSGGPMRMSFADYMADIGLTYVIIVIVPWAIGVAQGRGALARQAG